MVTVMVMVSIAFKVTVIVIITVTVTVIIMIHRKKRLATFSSPARKPLTHQTLLGGDNFIIPAKGEFGK
jgi:hypothetical protein